MLMLADHQRQDLPKGIASLVLPGPTGVTAPAVCWRKGTWRDNPPSAHSSTPLALQPMLRRSRFLSGADQVTA